MQHEELKTKISTPGRICLFGEHQDYLNLPIIACAISKRIFIEGVVRNDNMVNINLIDLGDTESFSFNGRLAYKKERDYIRSSVNVLLKEGYTFQNGYDCVIHGEIPINAGTSSSSALIVSLINFLSRISDQKKILSAEEIAHLAYTAEILEFSEPGGMMDHYSTAVGGIIYLSSYPKIQLEKINAQLGTFVLGNSEEPKETKLILARVKKGVLDIVDRLWKKDSTFSLQTIRYDDAKKYQNEINDDEYQLLLGTIMNRDITKHAKLILESEPLDHKMFGDLMNSHQNILRDTLKISTPKIDSMISAALDAGAFGAKINGSGGGGCMFAYAPENPEKVLDAVRKISPDTHFIFADQGTKLENTGRM